MKLFGASAISTKTTARVREGGSQTNVKITPYLALKLALCAQGHEVVEWVS